MKLLKNTKKAKKTTKAEALKQLEKIEKELSKFKTEKTQKAKIRRRRKKIKHTLAQLQKHLERKENTVAFLVNKFARDNYRKAYEQQKLTEQKERQKANPDQFLTTYDADIYFANDDNCHKSLEKAMFPSGELSCKYCGWHKVYRIATRKTLKCAKCRRQFSCRTGGIFNKSKISLGKWFKVIRAESNSTAKMTIREVRELIGVSQTTAVYMLHRIRHSAFSQDIFKIEAGSTVAIDTTAIFGRNVNRHDYKKLSRQNIAARSAQYLTIKQNNGDSIVVSLPNLTTEAKKEAILKYVPVGATIYTDEHPAFNFLSEYYTHETVNHSLGEHGRNEVSNNGAESVHALIKTKTMSHFNCFKQKHLQFFINSIVFQKNTNNRKLTAEEKFSLALKNIIRVNKLVKEKRPTVAKKLKVNKKQFLKGLLIRLRLEDVTETLKMVG